MECKFPLGAVLCEFLILILFGKEWGNVVKNIVLFTGLGSFAS